MANERQTLSHLSNQVRMAMSRATVREFDDDHLMQEVKYADVYHSETPSNFERWQMVGITATPMKQDEDEQQQQDKTSQKQGAENDGDWNHNQPKGDAAEAVMLYLNGSRSHPVAMVDDRRVRPYKVPEGGSAFYAASGTGQMAYHNDEGTYLIVTNNPKHGKNQQEKERFASLRHVNKKPQDRKKEQQSNGSGSTSSASTRDTSGGGSGSSQEYKHEGESVNTEVRTTKKDVQILDGDTVVARYDKQSGTWTFTSKNINLNASQNMTITAQNHLTVQCASGTLDLMGKPINLNGGGPSTPPFTVPG